MTAEKENDMWWKKNMEPLDWSRFNDILIEDENGEIQPMSQPYFKAKKIAEGTWQVLSDGDYSYLIEGEDEAIVIDAGMGAGNIRAFCQTLTSKPIYRMLLSHCHWDHTCNCYLFDAVYMSETSYIRRSEPIGEFAERGMNLPSDYPVVFIKEGDEIDLGNRKLEVYAISEHALGSLQFLDRKNRILFCGDELNGNFFDSRISVETSFRNVCQWKSFRDAYDVLAAGNGLHDAVYVDRYYETLKYILEGHAQEGVEHYVPYNDRFASIDEKDGLPVYARRAPHFRSLVKPLIDAGYEEDLAINHGRACFNLLRKLTPDGIFDRQLKKNDCTVCYYLNRIWDDDENNNLI